MDAAPSPAELRAYELPRKGRGYDREAVNGFLALITAHYERLWDERRALLERLDRLEQEVAHFRDGEQILRDALLTAHRAADETLSRANEEAGRLLEQARRDAAAAADEAKLEQTRLARETERLETVRRELHASLRAFLLAGLELVENEGQERVEAAEPARIAG